MTMQICRRCLYADTHPLGITFDAEGICSGCRIHEEKDTLDWDERWAMLQRLVEPYRSKNAQQYDCIVPVSGAADSYWIVHLVKERLGMNPLLVSYNKQFNTALGVRNLANLRIRFDCDILIQNVGTPTIRKVTRTTLRQFGSVYWHCLAGQTVFPVQTAVRYGIPLIIWGAHQGLEQVGMFSHEHEVEMSRRYRTDHDLLGRQADDLLSIFDSLTEEDVANYAYPDDAVLDAVGVRGIYLGNYVRWDPKAQHEKMIASHGFSGAQFDRTFDCYDYVDCYVYMDLHDQLKLYKHGYSKVTDHASREIRHGRLTRDQGLALVARHEQVAPRYFDKFCEWFGVTPLALKFIMDQHRNPAFWTEERPGHWTFHGWSTQQPTPLDLPHNLDSVIPYDACEILEYAGKSDFITVGKGYP
jgi:N-acetyl sugar amidotransferase